MGDTHGEFDKIKMQVKSYDLSNCVIFCVGDFGVGFSRKAKEKRRLENLNEFFYRRSISFWSIAGNHDDPSYFQGQTNLSNLSLLPDYTYLSINGKKILCVGGAISIDRSSRKLGYSYWKNEIIQPAPDNLEPADIIVAHDAPTYAGLGTEKLYDEPGNPVKSDALKGRRILDTLVETVAPELFIHGHYHLSQDQIINGTRFRCLDILEIWEIR